MYCCALLFERILIFVFPFSLPQPFTTHAMLCQFYDLLQVIDNYVDNSKLPADQSDIVLEKQIKVCVGVGGGCRTAEITYLKSRVYTTIVY